MREGAIALILGTTLAVFLAAPASAQATRTWVSGVGDDANPCSRTAPCKTFAGAISKTAAGGEINCLDPGGFGAVTITKSMTISCELGTAGVLVAGTNAIVVSAGASDFVYLKGLDIEGLGTGLVGITLNSGALLHVEDCVIRNFNGGSAIGIQIKPSNNAKFVISRTTLVNNGSGAIGAGIQVFPNAGATTGLINRVTADGNVFGVAVDGTGGTIGINVTIRDSGISGNSSDGVVVTTGAVGLSVMIERSSIANNAAGLHAINAGTIRVGSSTITGNGTATIGANVLSYGNNQINGNGADTIPGGVPGGLH